MFYLIRHAKWPLDLSTRIENQAYEKSHGIKVDKKNFKNSNFVFFLVE